MDVEQAYLGQRVDERIERLLGLTVERRLAGLGRRWRDADADPLRAPDLHHGTDHVEREAEAVLD